MAFGARAHWHGYLALFAHDPILHFLAVLFWNSEVGFGGGFYLREAFTKSCLPTPFLIPARYGKERELKVLWPKYRKRHCGANRKPS
jgi:hypothetical protein